MHIDYHLILFEICSPDIPTSALYMVNPSHPPFASSCAVGHHSSGAVWLPVTSTRQQRCRFPSQMHIYLQNSYLGYHNLQWVDFRENLQETSQMFPWNLRVSCIFSLKPTPWNLKYPKQCDAVCTSAAHCFDRSWVLEPKSVAGLAKWDTAH